MVLYLRLTMDKNYRENLLLQSLNDSYTLYLFNPNYKICI